MSSIRIWLSNYLSWFTVPTFSITVTDVLEILILAFLVYSFLLWVKNTRAWTLLKGIMVLVICVSLVYLLHMDTLIFIVNRGIDIAITAAIVIFQPELRRVLERIGEKKIVSSLLPIDTNHVTERFSDKTVNEIVKAASEMSRAKTGALIVIEQNVRLDEYERTGIVIDSVLTSQILINIFEHNTPLHDGAVIVRGNRITAATCYLPLSDNMLLSKELGTRHRAGVGISEVTDSLTVIVSEETGAISVAYKGELMRKLTAEELKKLLVMAQNKTAAQKKFRLWKGWNMKYKLTRNMGLKLLSLFVAFGIWLLVVNVNDPMSVRLFRDVKIQQENVESVTALDKVLDVVEDDVYGDTVIIKVKERKSVLKSLTASDFEVVADMETMNEMGSVPLRVECRNSAVTLDEIEVIPSVQKVKLEPKKQSEFIVNVVTNGKPENGYEVGTTEVVGGKTVQVAGAESILKKIDKVVAEVNTARIKSDQRLTGNIVIYDKNGDKLTSQMDRLQIKDSSGVLLSNNQVTVDVTLWQVMNDIPVKVETAGEPAEGYRITGITTIPVTINLVGTNEALARLGGEIAIADPVSVEGATENVTQEIDLSETLSSLEGVRLVADADPTISVTVQIEKTGDQTIRVPLSTFEVLNRPDSAKMSLTVSPADEVQISVHAKAGEPNLKVSDIKASVDFSECAKEGVYEVPVNVQLPEGYTLVSEVKLVVTATAIKDGNDEDSTEE